MALSEPHAGSSLATLRTLATPQPGQPGEYRIKGDKMWTTGAFHDLSDNIIHMLLARTPGAPPGAAGISLFLVPNVLPDGRPNDVELVSLNKKMGHRAITNCAWTLGEHGGGAVGYLVGREGHGLQCMFGMMNAMRIEVGLGAACLGKRGFLESVLYAQEREQGGCAIIEHDDVRRMLVQKASARAPTRCASPPPRCTTARRTATRARRRCSTCRRRSSSRAVGVVPGGQQVGDPGAGRRGLRPGLPRLSSSTATTAST